MYQKAGSSCGAPQLSKDCEKYVEIIFSALILGVPINDLCQLLPDNAARSVLNASLWIFVWFGQFFLVSYCVTLTSFDSVSLFCTSGQSGNPLMESDAVKLQRMFEMHLFL